MTAAPTPQQQSPQQPGESTIAFAGITHVLLDIEGTTCPVSFVVGTLFPYASAQLEGFLRSHGAEPAVQELLAAVEQAWQSDPDPEAQALRQPGGAAVVAYLQWLIRHDRKLTALKDLQGLIWAEGYRSGALQGPLFDDVAPALRRWHAAGVQLAVYSSGSVGAQQLIYGHSTAGDLRTVFNAWFDTRIGPKQDPQSYAAIAAQLGCKPKHVLFISDALAECEAAASSGLQVLYSDRPGNPERDSGPFEKINSFEALELKS